MLDKHRDEADVVMMTRLMMMQLQQLFTQRHPQTHMLRSLDGQSVDGVVVHHLRDAVEWSAELTQDVLSSSSQLDPHVHEPMTAPEKYLNSEKYLNQRKYLS